MWPRATGMLGPKRAEAVGVRMSTVAGFAKSSFEGCRSTLARDGAQGKRVMESEDTAVDTGLAVCFTDMNEAETRQLQSSCRQCFGGGPKRQGN